MLIEHTSLPNSIIFFYVSCSFNFCIFIYFFSCYLLIPILSVFLFSSINSIIFIFYYFLSRLSYLFDIISEIRKQTFNLLLRFKIMMINFDTQFLLRYIFVYLDFKTFILISFRNNNLLH